MTHPFIYSKTRGNVYTHIMNGHEWVPLAPVNHKSHDHDNFNLNFRKLNDEILQRDKFCKSKGVNLKDKG